MDRLIAAFDKSAIDEIFRIHSEIEFQPNHRYFKNACSWQNRHIHNIGDNRTLSHFHGLLSPVNLTALDYVLQNIDEFRPLIFIDSGSGHGMLSVFLELLGIDCYNYDNFSQIRQDICNDFQAKLKSAIGIKIRPVLDSIPSPADINLGVLINGAIWVDNKELLRHSFKYILTDVWYITRAISIIPQLAINHNKICSYGGIINVYKRREK